MNTYEMPTSNHPNEDQEEDLFRFFQKLMALCNEHRVSISIKDVFLLRNGAVDGILLDVDGFQRNEEDKIFYPIYVNRLSKNETYS